MSTFLQSLKILILAIILSIGVSYVYAWTGPTATAPDGNVSAPINVSATSQVKSGGLWVASLGTDGGATFGGSVKIGTSNAVCTSAISGMLRYNSTIVQYCNGSMWCALGTTCGINLVIESNTNNYNIYDAATAAGWVSGKAVTLTINSGAVVGSTSTDSPALTTGAFPAGTSVTIINNSSIIGAGGAGGTGGNAYGCIGIPVTSGLAGTSGGPALSVSSPTVINNNGSISGGGGGGGGGGAARTSAFRASTCLGGGGGGGGAGLNAGLGGSGGSQSNSYSSPSSPGTIGTLVSGGLGGSGAVGGLGSGTGGTGGNGGAPGQAGSAGNQSTSNIGNITSGGAGGNPGAAIIGNSNITWQATGDRQGPINN
ncbi:MAG: PE-PGRS family protein [Candidatus Kaiserbacteria bacterium GW2011_GWA2_49_19]|uniref:PE-PGRS family protein n=2 Tax=Candidatus Kaiseribacteriota TaxID=1752734 RepID=A0A0G1Y178_9BACT|nr:MAG: PE-PGRS family protein [Candidatus Kaiserbacteria bacterium GW2011_GWA2_49_19]OGG60097.1 MAG: hypothetical protein A3C86_00900 [Candidatus Kaiserbacteria bacterium RIFCSPHIGHO2_02_FULL_49_16]